MTADQDACADGNHEFGTLAPHLCRCGADDRARLPTSTVDATGYTYTHPHTPFHVKCPYDLTGATNWEAQEIDRYWHDATAAAERIHRVAHHVLLDLADVSQDPGDNRPQHLARDTLDLSVALSNLRGVHNGMRHRLAMIESCSPEV